jgi:hypothetical protein
MFVAIPPKSHKRYTIVVHYKYFKRLPLLITTVCLDTGTEPMRFKSKRELKHYIENIVMNRHREYNYNACNIVITEEE